MLEEPVLRKLLPLPYVPKEWQLTALRWWVNWRRVVLAVTALLAYAAINPYLMAWLESLPILAQKAAGLLFLAAMIGFLVWYHRQHPNLVTLFMIGAYIALGLAIFGVWESVTSPLAMVLVAATFVSLFGGLVWRFVQNRRTA